MSIEKLNEYIELVKSFDNTEFLYDMFMENGKAFAKKKDYNIRLQENYVSGCQSQVWVVGQKQGNAWTFLFETDTYMIYGIGKILLDTFNNLPAEEIKKITYHDFKPIAAVLSSQRQRGLQSIINKIHTIVG
jgi:cysteine desulfuration protein SufE